MTVVLYMHGSWAINLTALGSSSLLGRRRDACGQRVSVQAQASQYRATGQTVNLRLIVDVGNVLAVNADATIVLENMPDKDAEEGGLPYVTRTNKGRCCSPIDREAQFVDDGWAYLPPVLAWTVACLRQPPVSAWSAVSKHLLPVSKPLASCPSYIQLSQLS